MELGLASERVRQHLRQKSSQTRTGTTTHSVEDDETLERVTLLSRVTDFLHHGFRQLLAHCVVTTSKIVRGILFSSDHHVRVEQRFELACDHSHVAQHTEVGPARNIARARKGNPGTKKFTQTEGLPDLSWSTTEGSRSIMRALGTNLRELDSWKKVEKLSLSDLRVGIVPSSLTPCSRQKSSHDDEPV